MTDQYQHFNGKFEVELKYRVPNKAAFVARLKSQPCEVMLEKNEESDWYFDLPDRSLAAQNKHLVIREMAPSGIKLWIVKGPGSDDCEASDISDAKAARNMLENLGYEVVMRASKTRSIYFVGPYHITLDHLEGIGDFAEFAIMTDDESSLAMHRRTLIEMAGSFGLGQAQRETRSYRTLWVEHHA